MPPKTRSRAKAEQRPRRNVASTHRTTKLRTKTRGEDLSQTSNPPASVESTSNVSDNTRSKTKGEAIQASKPRARVASTPKGEKKSQPFKIQVATSKTTMTNSQEIPTPADKSKRKARVKSSMIEQFEGPVQQPPQDTVSLLEHRRSRSPRSSVADEDQRKKRKTNGRHRSRSRSPSESDGDNKYEEERLECEGVKNEQLQEVSNGQEEMSNELRRSLDDEQGPNQQASGKGMYVDEGGFRVHSISTELNDDSSSHKTRQMTNQEISMAFSDQSPLTRREPKRLPRQDGRDATLLPGDKVLIESSDFQQMVNARVSLVDKSMLIAEFVESHSEVSLVLRPRHFGKSTNLSMLRLFFECIEGETESKKRSRMELFNQFKVMKERPDLFSKEFGKYPVIFLALKDINGTTWNDMMTQMRKVISEIYREHGYLTQGLEDYEKPEFNSIIDMESASWDLSFALTNLSGYLADYHGSDCIVLIDDYDTPLRVAYNKGYYKEARDFFQNMFSSLLKDNSNLSKAFIVSVLPKAKSDFLGPNNISVYSMETSWYADMFGFTEHEVGLLFDRHKVNIPIADPQCQHNGYESGDYHQRYKLYNPWSILCLCADKELTRFRDKTTIKHLLFNAGSAFMSDVLRLLTIKNVENNADYNSITINDHRHIWALLLYAGYLTLNDEGQLTIPNDKVYMEWVNWIMPMLSSASLNSRLDELLSGETKYLEDMIVISLSDLDVGSEHSGIKAEAFFHGLYLGMLSHLRYKYDIHLNGDAESGRYDIRVLPKSAAQLAILMYLKVAHGKDSTNSAARNELDQVEANGYDVGIPSHVKKLLVFDILFDGNHTHVVVKKLRQNVSHEGKLEWCDGE